MREERGRKQRARRCRRSKMVTERYFSIGGLEEKVHGIAKSSNVKVHPRPAGVSNEAYCLWLAASDL